MESGLSRQPGSNLLSHEWIVCSEPGSQIRRLIDTMTTSCRGLGRRQALRTRTSRTAWTAWTALRIFGRLGYTATVPTGVIA